MRYYGRTIWSDCGVGAPTLRWMRSASTSLSARPLGTVASHGGPFSLAADHQAVALAEPASHLERGTPLADLHRGAAVAQPRQRCCRRRSDWRGKALAADDCESDRAGQLLCPPAPRRDHHTVAECWDPLEPPRPRRSCVAPGRRGPCRRRVCGAAQGRQSGWLRFRERRERDRSACTVDGTDVSGRVSHPRSLGQRLQHRSEAQLVDSVHGTTEHRRGPDPALGHYARGPIATWVGSPRLESTEPALPLCAVAARRD